MKPHPAIAELPLKIPVSTCCTAVLEGAGCTLLKLGELGSHLSSRILSFAVIYRNVFGQSPWQGVHSVTGDYISSGFRIPCWLLYCQQRDCGTPKGQSTLSGGGG